MSQISFFGGEYNDETYDLSEPQEDLVVKECRLMLLELLLDRVTANFDKLSDHQKSVLILASRECTLKEVSDTLGNNRTAIHHSLHGIPNKEGKVWGGTYKKLHSIMKEDKEAVQIYDDLLRLRRDNDLAAEILEEYKE